MQTHTCQMSSERGCVLLSLQALALLTICGGIAYGLMHGYRISISCYAGFSFRNLVSQSLSSLWTCYVPIMMVMIPILLQQQRDTDSLLRSCSSFITSSVRLMACYVFFLYYVVFYNFVFFPLYVFFLYYVFSFIYLSCYLI